MEARLEALDAEMHPDLEAYAKALQTLKAKMATVRSRAINQQIPISDGPSLDRGTGDVSTFTFCWWNRAHA